MDVRKSNALTMFFFAICIFILISIAVYFPEYVPLMNAVFAGILALITAVYVLYTKDILVNSSKQRQIDFISKQLEELYYPLSNTLDSFYEEGGSLKKIIAHEYADEIKMHDVAHNLSGGQGNEKNYAQNSNLILNKKKHVVNLSDLINKKYLFASGNSSKTAFEDFVDCFDTVISSNDCCKRYYRLKEAIKEDIEALEVELNKLTSSN